VSGYLSVCTMKFRHQDWLGNLELSSFWDPVACESPFFWLYGKDAFAVPHNQQFSLMIWADSVAVSACRVHRYRLGILPC
jgi:hypothetical protein